MDAQLTSTEINHYHKILQGEDATQKALATLEKHNGKFDESLEELYTEKFGTLPIMAEGKSLWQVTLKQLRQEVCGDEGFCFGNRLSRLFKDIGNYFHWK